MRLDPGELIQRNLVVDTTTPVSSVTLRYRVARSGTSFKLEDILAAARFSQLPPHKIRRATIIYFPFSSDLWAHELQLRRNFANIRFIAEEGFTREEGDALKSIDIRPARHVYQRFLIDLALSSWTYQLSCLPQRRVSDLNVLIESAPTAIRPRSSASVNSPSHRR